MKQEPISREEQAAIVLDVLTRGRDLGYTEIKIGVSRAGTLTVEAKAEGRPVQQRMTMGKGR